MRKQKIDRATRLYYRVHRVEKMADWLYEVSKQKDAVDLILECHRTSLMASRLMQVQQAQHQRGTRFASAMADVQERVEALETRLETLLGNWVVYGLDRPQDQAKPMDRRQQWEQAKRRDAIKQDERMVTVVLDEV